MTTSAILRQSQRLHQPAITARCLHHSATHHKKARPSLKGRSHSSQEWLQRQLADPFVKKAQTQNYRCRSAFKLLEIAEKRGFMQPGMTVIDCGAAPGSWSQVAVEKVNALGNDTRSKRGSVISVDLQYFTAVPGATILPEMDFTKAVTQKRIQEALGGEQADVILSDMAPNATGVKTMDHDLIIDLCMSVLSFANVILKDGGSLLCKIWQGGEQNNLHKAMEDRFQSVKIVKPQASRKDSAEIYFLGLHFHR